MKKSIYILAGFAFFSCNTQKAVVQEPQPPVAQEATPDTSKETVMETAMKAATDPKESMETAFNKTVPYKESVILVGKADREGLTQEPFNAWFNKNLDSYDVHEETVLAIKPLLKDVHVKAFMGTWCGDSKRETPRFYKIMDQAGFDYDNLSLITVTRQKNTPEKYEEGLNITNVPTFIFYKNGKEINRIVEFPVESLEKDILAILSGKEYKHSYAD